MTNKIKEIFEDFTSEYKDDFIIIPLKGDASIREYYRVIKGDNEWIFMDLSSSEENTGKWFFNIHSILTKNGIPVPAILKCDRELEWIILEDLGDVTLYQKINDIIDIPEHLYYKLIDTLIDIISIKPPEMQQRYGAFSRTFDVPRFTYELEFFKEHYIKGILGRRISKEDDDAFAQEFQRLSEIILSYPKFLTHRDYHSKNVMIKGGTCYIIDFQDARLGPPQYDLASLLFDSYIELDEIFRDKLKNRYIGKFKKIKSDFELDEFERIFNLTALQRNLKAIGTFAYQCRLRGNNNYLQFINPTMNYIKSHFKRIKGLEKLESLLKEYFD